MVSYRIRFLYIMIFSPTFKLILITIFLKIFYACILTLILQVLHNLFKTKLYTLEILKIKSFVITLNVVCFYIFFMVIGLVFYRFYNINKYLDLNFLYKNFKAYYTKAFFLDSIFITYYIIILLYSKLNSFFIKQCLILYLILFKNYAKDFKYIEYKFSLLQIKKNIYIKYIHDINNSLYNLWGFIIQKLPLCILILCIIYDLTINNKVLLFTGNFLPFYFFHFIWLKCSIFFEYSNPYLNNMIYNIYYKGSSLAYVNMGEYKEKLVNNYIKNKLQVNPLLLKDSFILDVDLYHTFKSKDGIYFENLQGEYFQEDVKLRRLNITLEFTNLTLLIIYIYYLLFCAICYYIFIKSLINI